MSLGVAIDRELHIRLKSACDNIGVTQSVYLREMLINALDSDEPPFARGWMEGYRAGYATVIARFTEVIAAEREQILNGVEGDEVIGFPGVGHPHNR